MFKQTNLITLLAAIFSLSASANHIMAADAYASMALPNDDKLYNAPLTAAWANHATLVQGVPRGDATPDYWSTSILDHSILSSEPWNAITIWFTAFEAQSNTNKNVRLVMGKPEVWLLRSSEETVSTNQANWSKAPISDFEWAAYYSSNIMNYISDTPVRYSEEGIAEYQISEQHYPIHGGTSRNCINGRNVLGAFVRVKAWVVNDKKYNDSNLEEAKILLSIGADYYPTVSSSVSKGDFANANYLPGAGGSRFMYLSTKPTWFYMITTTPDDLSIVDKSSEYYKSGAKTYLTREEWMTNYPTIIPE